MRRTDKRGSNKDRRRRKERMLEVYGDGDFVVCTWCPKICSYSEVTADRLEPGVVPFREHRSVMHAVQLKPQGEKDMAMVPQGQRSEAGETKESPAIRR